MDHSFFQRNNLQQRILNLEYLIQFSITNNNKKREEFFRDEYNKTQEKYKKLEGKYYNWKPVYEESLKRIKEMELSEEHV